MKRKRSAQISWDQATPRVIQFDRRIDYSESNRDFDDYENRARRFLSLFERSVRRYTFSFTSVPTINGFIFSWLWKIIRFAIAHFRYSKDSKIFSNHSISQKLLFPCLEIVSVLNNCRRVFDIDLPHLELFQLPAGFYRGQLFKASNIYHHSHSIADENVYQ